MRSRCLILVMLIAVAGLVCALTPASAQTGKNTVQELVTLFSAWSNKGKNADICDAAAKHIDYAGMAELSLTRSQWDKLSRDQKKELAASFRNLVEQRYYPRWHKTFLKGKLSFASEASTAGDTYVKTFLSTSKDDDTVIWRLHPSGNELVVLSLNVNGKDLLGRLSTRFQHQMEKHGFEGLLSWLKDKSDDEESDESSAADKRSTAARSR